MIVSFKVGCKTKWDIWSGQDRPPCTSGDQFRFNMSGRPEDIGWLRNLECNATWCCFEINWKPLLMLHQKAFLCLIFDIKVLVMNLQGVWFNIPPSVWVRVGGNPSDHWMQAAVQVQEVQFPGRTANFIVQIRPLHILPLGRLQQDKGGDWGADLPGFLFGGRIWGNPQSLSWILFFISLGQFQYPKKISICVIQKPYFTSKHLRRAPATK